MNARIFSLTLLLGFLSASSAYGTIVYGPDGALEITRVGNIYWIRNLGGGPTYTVLPLEKAFLIMNPNGSSTLVPYEEQQEQDLILTPIVPITPANSEEVL